jgi:hypothetical protein
LNEIHLIREVEVANHCLVVSKPKSYDEESHDDLSIITTDVCH